MGTGDKKRQVIVRVLVFFIAGLAGSILVSKLMPQIGWAAFVPMRLAGGLIITDVLVLMRGDE